MVSGGAKGVDEAAMLAALEVDGTALGILANGLLPMALSSKWRPHLRKNELCLVSPHYPEAPFHVGNAMGRNKYIYCLADYGLVVRSEKGEGGTWAGATEAIKKNMASEKYQQNAYERYAGWYYAETCEGWRLVSPKEADDIRAGTVSKLSYPRNYETMKTAVLKGPRFDTEARRKAS